MDEDNIAAAQTSEAPIATLKDGKMAIDTSVDTASSSKGAERGLLCPAIVPITTAAVDTSAVREQFLQLAKSAKGTAAVQLIKEALEAPGLYVFAELLNMPNIKDVSNE